MNEPDPDTNESAPRRADGPDRDDNATDPVESPQPPPDSATLQTPAADLQPTDDAPPTKQNPLADAADDDHSDSDGAAAKPRANGSSEASPSSSPAENVEVSPADDHPDDEYPDDREYGWHADLDGNQNDRPYGDDRSSTQNRIGPGTNHRAGGLVEHRDLQAVHQELRDITTEHQWNLQELDRKVKALGEELATLQRELQQLNADKERESQEPAPWLPFRPPPAAEEPAHHDKTPMFTMMCFIGWYNAIYVGQGGTRSVRIPSCWAHHPGLVAEIATLAYTWRAANIGRGANMRDAQYWHAVWRPTFAERLSEWVHPRCHDGEHKDVGAHPIAHRFDEGRSSNQVAAQGSGQPADGEHPTDTSRESPDTEAPDGQSPDGSGESSATPSR